MEGIGEHSAGSGDLRCFGVELWVLGMCIGCSDLVEGGFLSVTDVWVSFDLM